MNLIDLGLSAVTKLAALIVLAAAFLFGMAGVVYMSLQGSVISVPELVGKNLSETKQVLASLGLKVQVRASRPSTTAPDTVLEQLPKPGDTVKTGQLIFVVTSSQMIQSEETPATLKRSIEESDTEKIEEMISDKPKRRSNSNTNKKRADTTRDVIANTAISPTNSQTSDDPDKKEPAKDKEPDKENDSEPQTRPSKPNVITRPSPARPGGAGDGPASSRRRATARAVNATK